MICQNCGKREANTHIKQIINGDMAESHLCSDCARHLGYSDMFSGFDLDLADFFGGLLGDMMSPARLSSGKRCPKCGASFDDIVREGKVGCSQCYEEFYEKLRPSIQRIHGKIKHSGKTARAASYRERLESKEEKIETLTRLMEEAAAARNFEEAARLRDEIKEMEGGADSE